MKNVRFLKNVGLYTHDTVCIGNRYRNSPSGATKDEVYTVYYQPEKNLVILLYCDGRTDIFSFNCELMSVAFKIKQLSEFKFNLQCHTYGDYIKIFKLKLKYHGINDFRIRYSHLTDDDFGNYKITFKNIEDSAYFQICFSEFLE